MSGTLEVVREPGARRAVAVFSPGPILTVTIEGSGPEEIHVHAGGQGTWVTRLARRLGVDTTLCAPFGGETGTVIRHLLDEEGLATDPCVTRSWNGSYVHDRRSGARREIATVNAPPLTRHEADDLYGNILSRAFEAGICVLTGVRPSRVDSSMYRRLARDLRNNGVTVIADLSGDELHAALSGGIDVLKVSHEEIIEAGWADDDSDDALIAGARRLQAAGATTVVVSHAERPALAVFNGQAVRATGPRIDAIEPSGAGDSMTAALAAARAHGKADDQALELAVAAGALNATRRGLGTGEESRIRLLAERVTIEPFHEPVVVEDRARAT